MDSRSVRNRIAALSLSILIVGLLSACSSGRPSADLLDRVIREDCCQPIIDSTLYLSDGTELQVQGIGLMHPVTNRGVSGHDQFIAGYCNNREIQYDGELVLPRNISLSSHVIRTRPGTIYLERPVTVSVRDTRIEYRNNQNAPRVEYPALEYRTTSEQRIYKVVLDVEACNVTFEPTVQHTEYTTTWIDLNDRWAVHVLRSPRMFGNWREISKR